MSLLSMFDAGKGFGGPLGLVPSFQKQGNRGLDILSVLMAGGLVKIRAETKAQAPDFWSSFH